jgi:hypothetical protein
MKIEEGVGIASSISMEDSATNDDDDIQALFDQVAIPFFDITTANAV